jgi:hypothetical protein
MGQLPPPPLTPPRDPFSTFAFLATTAKTGLMGLEKENKLGPHNIMEQFERTDKKTVAC